MREKFDAEKVAIQVKNAKALQRATDQLTTARKTSGDLSLRIVELETQLNQVGESTAAVEVSCSHQRPRPNSPFLIWGCSQTGKIQELEARLKQALEDKAAMEVSCFPPIVRRTFSY